MKFDLEGCLVIESEGTKGKEEEGTAAAVQLPVENNFLYEA
jgi:hypothetical protein